MKNNPIRLLVVFLAVTLSIAQADAQNIKALIVDGQNNHRWEVTTPLLKLILENSGIFTVDVSTAPPSRDHGKPRLPRNATPEQKVAHETKLKGFRAGAADRKAQAEALWPKWRPHFANYDVVISNYNGEDWPEEVRAALLDYVRQGGGFVSYHAADNAFPRWKEYSELVGLVGFGKRDASTGPYLRLRDGEWVREQTPGKCGDHGPRKEFPVTTFAPDHPIMNGLPLKWMHAQDELYCSMRGPAKNLSVLGHARSGKTKEEEPMLMAISFGKGRVFHTTLGHHVEALDGLGFQITFLRGAEWAATGQVTQASPAPGILTQGPKAALRPLKLVSGNSAKPDQAN